MKVLFITNGLTHYYNRVLSKLNHEPGIKLTVVISSSTSAHIGKGVYQTREGIDFAVIELEETRKFGFYWTFKGLSGVLLRERPDVVIVIENYLNAFLLDISVVIAMKRIHAGLILKSIPFRFPSYQEVSEKNKKNTLGFSRFPPMLNRLLFTAGVTRFVRRLLLVVHKRALCLPDAHVNYIEAYDLWASYGVGREKIFITRNSPDTDLLFRIKDSLTNAPPILPLNCHRLLHVGRLVEWKRVDMLMRAFARVQVRFPDAELIIIGTGPEEAALKKLRYDLHLGMSVIFVGGVYDPRLLGQYYIASALYVLAGMGGLSINEAMCFGLPVLCSVCDGTEKVLVREGMNGRYFHDGVEDDLLEKIIWFFDFPERLQAMGCKSEEIIRNEVNIRTVINGYMQAFYYVRWR